MRKLRVRIFWLSAIILITAITFLKFRLGANKPPSVYLAETFLDYFSEPDYKRYESMSLSKICDLASLKHAFVTPSPAQISLSETLSQEIEDEEASTAFNKKNAVLATPAMIVPKSFLDGASTFNQAVSVLKTKGCRFATPREMLIFSLERQHKLERYLSNWEPVISLSGEGLIKVYAVYYNLKNSRLVFVKDQSPPDYWLTNLPYFFVTKITSK